MSAPHLYRDTEAGILIRPWEPMDAEPHFEAATASIGEVHPWLPWCRPGYTRRESAVWIGTRAREWELAISYDFVVVDARDGGLLGGVGLNNLNRERTWANLGYWVRTGRGGRGVATAAGRLALGFGFGELGLARIEISVAPGNLASVRVAEKLGARFECRLGSRMVTARGVDDALMYAILREEWARTGD